jgi:hypothetical protein
MDRQAQYPVEFQSFVSCSSSSTLVFEWLFAAGAAMVVIVEMQ